MSTKLEELQTLTEGIDILYIEDNEGLRKNVEQILLKIFSKVLVAGDGLEGYKSFVKYKPQLIITDIKMPKVDGLSMAKRIKREEPNTKIIYVTAHDDKENMLQAIEAGVFRYLPKPTKVNQLIDTLHDAITLIHYEESKQIFANMLKDIFNYQNNLLIMFEKKQPIIVNQRFLDFFGIMNLEEFLQKYPFLDQLLKEHESFLYSTEHSTWFETAMQTPGKLYHTKMIQNNDETRHLIMKLLEIPEKKESIIVSFDDVTELNLMALYDKDATVRDKARQDKKSVLTLMNLVNENHTEVKLHNFYRGLTITNPAVIIFIDDEKVIVKTCHSQLKIVKIVKNMTISSDIFPSAVLCKTIKEIDFDKGIITFSDMQFIERSGNDRQNIRLEPEENHVATLFLEGKKFFGETKIVDISIVSVKLEIDALPPKMEIDQEVNIAIVLHPSGAPVNLNVIAKIYRIDEYRRRYHIIALFKPQGMAHKQLLDYLAQRQMTLIREFKSLDIAL
ncbi:MAG: response regulator [Thiovulaceae bacterium]|nr:response regulator [Sulfurimonadaceae bacterium]